MDCIVAYRRLVLFVFVVLFSTYCFGAPPQDDYPASTASAYGPYTKSRALESREGHANPLKTGKMSVVGSAVQVSTSTVEVLWSGNHQGTPEPLDKAEVDSIHDWEREWNWYNCNIPGNWSQPANIYGSYYPGYSYYLSDNCPGAGGGLYLQPSCSDGSALQIIGGSFACGGSSTPAPPKNLGSGPCLCNGSDPINDATGNNFLDATDWRGAGPLPLRIERYYNSKSGIDAAFGYGWTSYYYRTLGVFQTGSGSTAYTAVVSRPDGRIEYFSAASATATAWTSDAHTTDRLVGSANGWTLYGSDKVTEAYDTSGRLVSISNFGGAAQYLSYNSSGELTSVKDSYGRALIFTYDSSGHIQTATVPGGYVYTYGYDSNGNLASVAEPPVSEGGAGITRSYIYDSSSFPHALTGVVDEGGNRYATWSYDANGSVNDEYLGGHVKEYSFNYSQGSAVVTDPLGAARTVSHSIFFGGYYVSGIVGGPCDGCGPASTQFDANGYPASYTDFNGNVTATTYDTTGLLDQRIDASGTASQRTTNFTWNTTLRVPLTRVVLNAAGTTVSSTQWVYNAAGQTLARCEIDPTNSAANGYACSASGTVPAGVRRWTYTYCTAVDGTQCPIVGLLLTATGPRTDIAQTTSYSYYLDSATSGCPTPGGACHQPGDLHTVTDPLGHVTTVASYDADGRPTRITDANGINTDLTYTPRGWLASRTVGGATTTFGYTPYGAVSSVTDPDGVTTTYGYDAAHRLVKVTDAQGNYVQYTLDAAGDKTAEQVFDSNGTVHQSLSRTFNALGQLTTVVDGLNHTVFNASAVGSYDANGNLVQSSDGLGIQRQQSYDALNRLVQTIDNYNGTN